MRARIQGGFTLVEILIALTILGIVVAQAFAIFIAQHSAYTGTERSIEVQEDVRLVSEAVQSDVRMAGFMVPQVAGIASVDGGNGGSDILCASDPTAIADTEIADALARFDRSSALAAVGAAATSVQLSAGHLDVDGDGNNDFSEDSGVILADGTSSHCARITQIAGNTIDFSPATPAGFALTTGTGRVTPAVVYEVDAGGLARNLIRLSTLVEDLQVEFGVDANGDGDLTGAEFPIHDLNGSDPTDILAVRLSVITRSDSEDPELKTVGRPAAANRTGGASDGFRRRRVTSSVAPRNLL